MGTNNQIAERELAVAETADGPNPVDPRSGTNQYA